VVTPVPHLLEGQFRVVGEQRVQPGHVSAVEDLPPVDLGLELDPRGEPVLPRHGQLGRVEDQMIRHRVQSSHRVSVAALGRPEKVLRLVAELVEIGLLVRLQRRVRITLHVHAA